MPSKKSITSKPLSGSSFSKSGSHGCSTGSGSSFSKPGSHGCSTGGASALMFSAIAATSATLNPSVAVGEGFALNTKSFSIPGIIFAEDSERRESRILPGKKRSLPPPVLFFAKGKVTPREISVSIEPPVSAEFSIVSSEG